MNHIETMEQALGALTPFCDGDTPAEDEPEGYVRKGKAAMRSLRAAIAQSKSEPTGERAALIARLRDYDQCNDGDVDAAADMLEADGKQVECEPVAACRGYALLGTGNYVINHSADFDEKLGAELIITLATDEDRSNNRKIGESRPTIEPGKLIEACEMVIRIGFLNERGLFALEDQLSEIRKIHFGESESPVGYVPLSDAAICNAIDEAGLNNHVRDDTLDLAIGRAIERAVRLIK